MPLSPINSDGSTNAEAQQQSKDSDPTNASTSSGKSESLGGWKLAAVVVGVVGAVVAAVFFVHARHVRMAAASKRSRGSSEQRALDSFFRQNRVTVPRETGGSSSNNFVSDPLTPRDEIAVTMPSNNQQAHVVAGAAALAFNSRNRPGSGAGSSASIETPTESYHGNNDYDSFTGNAPSMVSVASSGAFGKHSEFSESSSLGSIAPSATSSQRSAQVPGFPTRLETVVASQIRTSKRGSSAASFGDAQRDTQRSDRSSSDFSVFNASVDEDEFYRMSTQIFDVSALPVTTSEHSEPRESGENYRDSGMSDALSEFSVDDSYATERITGNSYTSDRNTENSYTSDRITENSYTSDRITENSYTSDRRTDNSFATNLSVDDSYATEGSYATVDSFGTHSTQDTDTDDEFFRRDSDSLVFRTSKESELSEGEI
ncbi:uncharacterized protein IUM83_14293 [Phytophthora cinnamomi]|uniref:uncharacterized protein n=1 Tax=Phytophthora cinnamomi TaxID=4785 RepID=UPI00355A56C8|nr:hypothetical protein IUM83_14293 [Phytophthora cinnamomi]